LPPRPYPGVRCGGVPIGVQRGPPGAIPGPAGADRVRPRLDLAPPRGKRGRVVSVTQALEPGATGGDDFTGKENMKATSLLSVFILAKLLVLAGRNIPLSLLVPWAY